MGELLTLTAAAFDVAGGTILVGVVTWLILLALVWTDRAPLSPWVARLMLGATAAIGLVLALRHLSILDDANYSFRYAENWAAGRGLVFNEGERVEGYTNFLWVVLLAAGTALTPFRPHWIALVLGLASFLANVVVVSKIGARLAGEERAGAWLPVAAATVALQTTMQRYATTGLETQLASLLVDLGLWGLLCGRVRAAGGALVLATLTRPDHAIFWLAGLAALPVRDRRSITAYASSLLPLGAVIFAKVLYYGTILPNSFYARAADEPHLKQGLVYGLSFLLGSHLWLVGGLFLASLALDARSSDLGSWRRFALVAVPAWVAYVVWIGGDYNYGRFFVVILPVLALGAAQAVHAARARNPWAGAAIGGLLLGSATGLPLLGQGQRLAGIVDETLTLDHSWRDLVEPETILSARAVYAFEGVEDRGIDLTIEGTGGFAYRTHMRVVEACGLVDPQVARRGREGNNAVGHERCLDREALLARGVRLSFTRSVFSMGPSERVPKVKGRAIDEFCDPSVCIRIMGYEREQMSQLAREVPSLHFVDFDAWLDDYLASIEALPPAQVANDLEFFREYWFRFNEDPLRLAGLEAAAGGLMAPGIEAGSLPGMSGFRESMH